MSYRVLEGAPVLHSLGEGATPFDFDTVLEHLDGPQPPEPYRIEVAREIELVLRWLVGADPLKMAPRRRAMVAGRRAFVLVWMAAPCALNNMSMRQLSRHLGTQEPRLSEIAARVPRELHFKNRIDQGLVKVS